MGFFGCGQFRYTQPLAAFSPLKPDTKSHFWYLCADRFVTHSDSFAQSLRAKSHFSVCTCARTVSLHSTRKIAFPGRISLQFQPFFRGCFSAVGTNVRDRCCRCWSRSYTSGRCAVRWPICTGSGSATGTSSRRTCFSIPTPSSSSSAISAGP
jgi:hypothetical protein